MLLLVQKALYAAARPSRGGRDIAHAFAPGKLDADTRKSVGTEEVQSGLGTLKVAD